MRFRQHLLLTLAAALAFVAGGASQALAQADITQVVVINEDDGFSGVCTAPCFALQKKVDVFFDGNPSAPGVCAAGENTYVYELTHIGGTIPSPNIPITEFELTVNFASVASAGFIPGAGIAPTSVTVSPINAVSYDFPDSNSCPACLDEGMVSEKLYICSTAGPGSSPDNVSTTAIILDAPGECIVPVPAACDIDIDKTCCVPPPPGTGGDDDSDSDSDHDSDSDSDSDHDSDGDSDGASDSDAASDSDSDSDMEDICDSRVVRAQFELVGGDCSDGTNQQGGKAKCHGPNPIVNPVLDEVDVTTPQSGIDATPNMDLMVGTLFDVTSSNPSGLLRKNTRIHLDGPGGTQKLRIHTSCSKAIKCGDQFGALKVTELETELGGVKTCEPPPPSSACVAPGTPVGTQCEAKLKEAVFKFSPSACQDPLPNPQNGEAECEGDASDANLPVSVRYTGKKKSKTTVSPSSGIGDGDIFRVTATGMKSLHPNMELKIEDDDSIEQSIDLHVSCSQPLACGDQFGSLTLIGFTAKNGQVVDCDQSPPPVFQDSCECPLAPPTPHCTSDLEELQLVYLKDLFGSDCSVSNDQGGEASCVGDDLTDDDVSITILTDPSNISADPDTGIDETGVISIVKLKPSGLKDELPNEIQFSATDGSANSQTVTIHTSCSEPLNLGDRFGDFVVFALDRGDGDSDSDSDDSDSDSDSDHTTGTPGEDGLISLGCEIEYQYKITNPNATQLVDITIDDDPHGLVVSGETLDPSEMKTFFTTKTLFETTMNTATVTGDLATGEQCTAGQDDVTVTVTLPPQGSFDCSDAKPIDELTMEWGGAQTINVKAWDGAVGGTLLHAEADVDPGDLVTVSGMGGAPNDQVWEIFTGSGTWTKIGESKFHISCSDSAMNGVEDCGKNQGNGKSNDAGLINDWLLEGMSGDEDLVCTPATVPSGGAGSCGVGFELVLLLPGAMWLYRRRRRS